MMTIMQTIVTPPDHSPDEYSIARLLSTESASHVVTIQTKLQDLFGDAIWLQEPPSLHVTLMEIICDAEYHGRSRRQLFEEWYAAYSEAVTDVLSTIDPFDITFNTLLVSQRAIIIKAADPAALNGIRAALLKNISLPPGTKIPPDITHSTLARFNRPIDLEAARRQTSGIPVYITEHVSGFSLLKDLGPPDFNGAPMATYSLKLA